MEAKKAAAGTSLESLMSSFNTRIAELQDLVIARNSLSLSLSLSSLFRPRLHPWMLMLMLLFANCSVPGDKRNGFVSGGRSIEGDGASAPLYQGPLARRNPRYS